MKFVKFIHTSSMRQMACFLILLVVALALTACSSAATHNISAQEFNPFRPLPAEQRMMNSVRIKWEIREDVAQYCARAYQFGREQAYLSPPLACAIWDAAKNECTMVTGPLTTHVALGHEVRHCFEGHFHR